LRKNRKGFLDSGKKDDESVLKSFTGPFFK